MSLDNFKQQREIFHSLPWKGNFWWKAFLYFYGNYTRKQEQMTPNFQRFYAFVQERYGDNIPQELRDEFRALSLPLMKYTNILTFNTRDSPLHQPADRRTVVVFHFRDGGDDQPVCVHASSS